MQQLLAVLGESVGYSMESRRPASDQAGAILHGCNLEVNSHSLCCCVVARLESFDADRASITEVTFRVKGADEEVTTRRGARVLCLDC